MSKHQYDISIVVPLLNEEESLQELTDLIDQEVTAFGKTYEVVMIDDGSTDGSWAKIEQLSAANPSIKGIKFRRNYGKSAALNVGFEATRGEVVITMDADLQDNPGEIPDLYKMIMDEGYHLISGWKKKRYDPITKTVPTKLFNWATRKMSGIHLHDFNCGLKAYHSDVVKNIEVYGEMHRYIPVIAKWAGFSKIGEKVVQHQERKHGVTKFGLERFVNGFLDLMSITFISRFGKKPMHLFGLLGTFMFMLGFGFIIWMLVDKIFIDTTGKLIANRTEFFLSILMIILGTQFFLAGFIGEMIARNNPRRNQYQVQNRIDHDVKQDDSEAS